jgi:Flp pilus assembly protein TadG
MVEFALILPVLLVIVIGIMNFGEAFNYWNNLNQMAADGARFAAVDSQGRTSTTCTNNKGYTGLAANITTQGEASYLCGRVKVCFTAINASSGQTEALSAAQPGDSIKVSTKASYTFANFGALNIGQIWLKGNATMRIERVDNGGGLASLGQGDCS